MCPTVAPPAPGRIGDTPQGDAENYVSVRNSAGSPSGVSDLSVSRE
jgi:isoaspartyl peptidase/L-asparaginase-like protein (Ntn-hydrolase superfamily)